MRIIETGFPDLYIIEPRIFTDIRGFFFESYNLGALKDTGLQYNFVQDNHSRSNYGVLRGLHYQKGPFAQTKLVRVVRGAVIDVAVDLRKGSPTFLKYYALELNESNNLQLLIPKGFAHGFIVISNTADFLYKCDNYYNKSAEGGIVFNDPQLAIDWGIPGENIILNDKDGSNPNLKEADFEFPFAEYTGNKLYE